MRVALVPLNPRVGDVFGNLELIEKAVQKALEQKTDLVIFPELSLLGYPPRDLVFLQLLHEQQRQALARLLPLSHQTAIIVGGISINPKNGQLLHNTAYLLLKGRIKTYHKQLLPNYDVFHERRYFEPGLAPLIFKLGGKKWFVTICEDIWSCDKKLKKLYGKDPLLQAKKSKVDYVINISASPFEENKIKKRRQILHDQAQKIGAGIFYVNQYGANDHLIFDGGSGFIDKSGKWRCDLREFDDAMVVVNTEDKKIFRKKPMPKIESLKRALVLGIKDYLLKTSHRGVVIGLSGGIDSSVVACLAVLALGSSNVLGVLMPSRYSSEGSISDAEILAKKLGVHFITCPLEQPHAAMENLLRSVAEKNQLSDITEQNLQARLRGNILMALANNTNRLALNTTNKSEMTMGYGTLYGDLCGAIAVIGDLTKDRVYELGRHLNQTLGAIPENVFLKAPSAELKPHQKDEDSLPAYSILDPFVREIIEKQNISLKNPSQLRDVLQTVFINEYKRQQAPFVLRVTERSFGSGRLMPIAAKISFEHL